MSVLLETRSVCAGFGQVRVLHDVSVAIASGVITAIIGSNGAGKTTLMRLLAGLLRPDTGEVLLENRSIGSIPAFERVSLGVSLVPEGRLVFPDISVHDTLRIGAYSIRARAGWEERRETMYEMFPRLRLRRGSAGGSLSGGEQQMLAIARALMSVPEILLLDEPSLGLSPIMADEIMERLITIGKQGTTICLVEQNVYSALGISEYAYVLENGRIVMEGQSADLMNRDSVRQSYLGL